MSPASWSSDGNYLILTQGTTGFLRLEIGVKSMEGNGDWKPLMLDSNNQAQPTVSPGGRWIAYTSNRTGQYEVWVRPFPDVESGGLWQVSTNGGDSPLWSPDGSELFYRKNGEVFAVPIETEPTFSPGIPTTLFRGTYVSSSFILGTLELTPWDIHPDGERFLMIKEAETREGDSTQGRSRKINVVLNWFEELKERVPIQ
jgi:hypothetical protein